MNPPTEHPRRHFDELVPFYLTGRIADEDRAWVEQHLARHPQAKAELDWHRDLMAEVVGKAEARAMSAPEMIGWSRVEAEVRAELRASRTPVKPTISERVSVWLGALTTKPMAAFATALIVAQAAVIGTMLTKPDPIGTELTRGNPAAARDVLQVRFKQAATEHDLRMLLYAAGARIVDGPDQLGDYVVEPRRGALPKLAGELGRSELVQSVTTLKAWKQEPREE
ncbi:MAG: hypothetical protein ABIU95_03905 [Burkholderiales bacterium]